MATDVQTIKHRGALEEERSRIQRQLSELGIGASGDLSYDPNFADTSQVTAERGEAEVLGNELQETLDSIDDALDRLEAGTYGRCERCGNEISEERLSAMPFARLCITCASQG